MDEVEFLWRKPVDKWLSKVSCSCRGRAFTAASISASVRIPKTKPFLVPGCKPVHYDRRRREGQIPVSIHYRTTG